MKKSTLLLLLCNVVAIKAAGCSKEDAFELLKEESLSALICLNNGDDKAACAENFSYNTGIELKKFKPLIHDIQSDHLGASFPADDFLITGERWNDTFSLQTILDMNDLDAMENRYPRYLRLINMIVITQKD